MKIHFAEYFLVFSLPKPDIMPKDILTISFGNVFGCARGLVYGLALLRALPVADLRLRLVALLHHLLGRLLLERDLAQLLEVLFANFLLNSVLPTTFTLICPKS